MAEELGLFLATWNLQQTLAGKLLRKQKWIFRLFLTPRPQLHFSSSDHDCLVRQFAILPVVCLMTFEVRAHCLFTLSAVSSSDHCGKLHLCKSWLHLLWLCWWHCADFQPFEPSLRHHSTETALPGNRHRECDWGQVLWRGWKGTREACGS